MKTTKLVMITALVSFALMSFANTELGTSKNVIHLKTAMTNPEMAATIYSQVEPTFFLRCGRCPGSHTAEILFKKTVYLVTGTFTEWRFFFKEMAKDKPLLQKQNPGSYNDSNPFSKDGTRVNPFSERNPFSNKGKKPTVRKSKGPKVDRH